MMKVQLRTEGYTAADMCIPNLRGVEKMLDRIDGKRLAKAVESLDAGQSQRVIRDAVFGD
jgi:hypothetical protein